MKKKVLIGLAIFSLAALLAVGAWAWFTAEAEPVDNEFTTGTVTINLVDEFEEVTNWNPGDCNGKIVYVENTGSKCAFVRVKLTPVWEDEELGVENVAWEPADDWFLHTDGWYYYTRELEGTATFEGEGYDKTSNLIEEVCLAGPETDDAYQGQKFTLTVEAEAIQCSNGAISDEAGWDLPDPLPWLVE